MIIIMVSIAIIIIVIVILMTLLVVVFVVVGFRSNIRSEIRCFRRQYSPLRSGSEDGTSVLCCVCVFFSYRTASSALGKIPLPVITVAGG